MSTHVTNLLDSYVHDLLDPAATAGVEHHLAACADCRMHLAAARRRQAAVVAALPAVEPSANLVRETMEHIAADAPRRRRRKARILLAMFTPLAAAAVILLLLQNYYTGLHAAPVNVEVLGQDRLIADSPAALRVRVTDPRTHTPLVGVPVEVALGDTKLASFTTDADGTGKPTFRVPDWADGSYVLKVTATAPSGPDVSNQTVKLRRSAKLMLSSDKPVYQPGQTIRLRALTLRQPDLRPVADRDAVFTVTDPKGNVVFKHAGRTSRFGIAAADCPLAIEILEGPYAVECKVGDTDSKLSVDVHKYVLPKFKVGVEFDKPYYQPGEAAQVKVAADYFHGKPVAGGMVEVEAKVGNDVVLKMAHKTDDSGQMQVAFALPPQLAGGPPDGDAKLTLTATVTDTAGQKQARTVTRAVAARPFKMDVIPENGVLVPGVANRMYVFASTPDGQPARVRGTITFAADRFDVATSELGVATFTITPHAGMQYMMQYALADGAGASVQFSQTWSCVLAADTFLIRTDKATYSGGETMHMAILGAGGPAFVDLIKDGQTIRTDAVTVANGQGTLDIDLPAESVGTLELCAYRFNAAGVPVRKVRTLYVRPASQLQVRASTDKPEYRPGEIATVSLALTDDKGRPVPGALSVAAVDEAVFSVLESMPGMERTFYLLEQELLKPVTTVYPWDPFAPTSPQRTEFEQALFARTTRTVGMVPVTRNVMRDLGNRFVTETVVEMVPDNSAQTPHTLSVETFPARERMVAAERVQKLQKVAAAKGWLAVCGGFALYTAAWLLFGGNRVGAGVLGGLTAVALMIAMAVTYGERDAMTFSQVGSRIMREPPTAMMPPAMEAAPRSEAVAVDPVGASVPIRVRDRFPETLLWRPEVVTDDNGRATLPVELADSITTWRLTAGAVTADGRLGALQAGVRVFQPFFVELNLPVALTRGDAVTLPVVVSSYLPRPQTVEVSLTDADWFDRTGDATRKVELQPNEVKAVQYRIRVKRVGNHQLKVTAKGEGVADAVRRPIEVVPDGRKVERVVNGTLAEPAAVTLDLPADAIDGSGRAVVKIYPSSFSQLVEGLDAVFQMPYGCFEQTSSTTYPNVLALDYLKRTGKASPQVEAKARQYVHLGYQRLVSFEVPGGGFEWFGHPPAHDLLTAYGLMEFADMARVHDVDPNLIARTRRWLLARRKADGTWPAAGGMHAGWGGTGLRATAYIAWAVFGEDQRDADPTPTLNAILSHAPESIADPNELALVCNALLALDARHPAVAGYLSRLDSLKRTSPDGRLVWWELPANGRTPFYGGGVSGNVETTALAALAFLKAGDRPGLVRQALTWIAEQKDANGTWHSTQATVLALKALLAGTGRPLGGDDERRVEFALDGRPVETVVIPADQAEVMRQVDLSRLLKPGGQRLTVTERTKTAAGFQVSFRYHVQGEPGALATGGFKVDLNYNRDTATVGDAITATATVTNKQRTPAPMVMLDLPIPAGFAVDPAAFDALVRAGTAGKYQVTPRQVIVYLRGLRPGEAVTVKYPLRATLPMTLTVPAARAYEYYDPAVEGRSTPVKLTVK